MSDDAPSIPVLAVSALGRVPYRDGLRLQEGMVQARASGRIGDWLLFPDHPPVLTMGRGGDPNSLRVNAASLAGRGIELFEVARGGDVTWHGPGQIVGYPIFDLARRGRDLHRFLRDLEEVLIAALAKHAIEARRAEGRTGVWVGEEKIASIGVAVRRWVSYHGFALNVAPELESFELIHPCGLRGIRMTSVAALLGDRAPSLETLRETVAREVVRRFDYGDLVWTPGGEAWKWIMEEAGTADHPIEPSGAGFERNPAALPPGARA